LCCHGGIEPAYNPKEFLDSKKTYEAIKRFKFKEGKETLAGVEGIESKISGYGSSDGFWQSYFKEHKEKNKSEPIIDRPNQPDGYLVDTGAITNFLQNPELGYKNVKAFFRAHQHSFWGLKMVPKIDEEPVIVRKKVPGEGEGLPWWKDVVLKEKNINENGFPISSFGPFFTFSSAPEGASYPNSPLNYDCMGILSVAKDYNDWRLIPYEIPLDPDRNGKFVSIEKRKEWKEGEPLIKIEETLSKPDDIKINDCLKVEYVNAPKEKISLDTLKNEEEKPELEEIKNNISSNHEEISKGHEEFREELEEKKEVHQSFEEWKKEFNKKSEEKMKKIKQKGEQKMKELQREFELLKKKQSQK